MPNPSLSLSPLRTVDLPLSPAPQTNPDEFTTPRPEEAAAESVPVTPPRSMEGAPAQLLLVTPSRPMVESPAQPTLVTPPRADIQAFGFFKAEGKTIGYTPSQRNTIQLSRYEGKAHLYIRRRDNPIALFSSDMDLTAEQETHEDAQFLHLHVQLKALKHRVEMDSHRRRVNGVIESGHYYATLRNIQRAINAIKNYMYSHSCNSAACLSELNAAIARRTIYNPFSLRARYGSKESDYKTGEINNSAPLTPQQLGLKLDIQPLIDLKEQVDKDYYIVNRYGKIAPEHYARAKHVIQCVLTMLNLNTNAPDFDEFLTRLNQKIRSRELYNPLGLFRIYQGAHYNKRLANDTRSFTQPINKFELIPYSLGPAVAHAEAQAPKPH